MVAARARQCKGLAAESNTFGAGNRWAYLEIQPPETQRFVESSRHAYTPTTAYAWLCRGHFADRRLRRGAMPRRPGGALRYFVPIGGVAGSGNRPVPGRIPTDATAGTPEMGTVVGFDSHTIRAGDANPARFVRIDAGGALILCHV